jgi:hypothetical protein
MWHLAEHRASFSIGPLSAQVDLAQPEMGLQSVQIGAAAWTDTSLLRVRLPAVNAPADVKLAETYVRGCDLVATYEPLPPFTLQPQIYWRLRHDATRAAYGLELIVSVQTSQLYSEPQTPVGSQLAGARSITTWTRDGRPQSLAAAAVPLTLRDREGAQGMVAFEPTVGGHIYVEMIQPGDFHAVSIEAAPGGKLNVAVQVFQEHLEKGVIRRARVCGWFLPQADWQVHAWELYQAFAAEPPPLTA